MRLPRVFLDANVVVDAQVRDIFCRLGEAGLIDLRWSEQILDEVRRALVENLQRPPAKVDQLLRTLERAFPLAAVSGFDRMIEDFDLPDPDDRHVVAAAVYGECDVLVTYNERDIRSSAVADHDLVVLTTDEALVLMARWFRDYLPDVIEAQVAALKKPATTIDSFLDRLADRTPMGATAIGDAVGVERFQHLARQMESSQSNRSPQSAVGELVDLIRLGDVDEVAARVDGPLSERLTNTSSPSAAAVHRALSTALEDVLTSDGWGFATAPRLVAPDIELVKLLRMGTRPLVAFEPRTVAQGHLFYLRREVTGWILVDLDGPDPGLAEE